MPEIIGQFIGYEVEDGYKIKRLQILSHQGIQSIKLAKAAKAALFRLGLVEPLQQGDLIKLTVAQKQDHDRIKFKAYDVVRCDDTVLINPSTVTVAKVSIQVCDRGTCRKRGSQQVYQSFCAAVESANLAEQVCIETTGCLKQCQQGTNVKINGACYSQVVPEDAAKLLQILG
jgi:hypothetical protein